MARPGDMASRRTPCGTHLRLVQSAQQAGYPYHNNTGARMATRDCPLGRSSAQTDQAKPLLTGCLVSTPGLTTPTQTRCAGSAATHVKATPVRHAAHKWKPAFHRLPPSHRLQQGRRDSIGTNPVTQRLMLACVGRTHEHEQPAYLGPQIAGGLPLPLLDLDTRRIMNVALTQFAARVADAVGVEQVLPREVGPHPFEVLPLRALPNRALTACQHQNQQ